MDTQSIHDKDASFTQMTAIKKAEQRVRRINILFADLLKPAGLSAKLKKITDGVVEIFDAYFAGIWLIMPGDLCNSGCIHVNSGEGPDICRNHDKCLHLKAGSGHFSGAYELDRRIPLKFYKIGGFAAGNESKFIINDILHDPNLHDQDWFKKHNLISFAGYRLLDSTDNLTGVLALACKHTIMSDEDVLLESIATVAAQVVQFATAEENLRESEKKYKCIFNSSNEMIITVDNERHIVEFNESAKLNFGYNQDEILGNDVNILYETPSEGGRVVDTLLETGEFVGEITNIDKYGKTFRALLSASMVRDAEGNIIGTMGISRNISEEELARRAMEDKLSAEAANRAKGEFLANMSHEIRTPMNSIIGFTELAMKTELTPKQQNYLQKIKTSGRSLIRIIDDILDFSKIEAGKLLMENVDFQLHDVLGNLSDMFSIKAGNKGIEMIISVDEDVPYALIGDPLRIGQVLINLTSNAIKFMDKGDVVINVALENRYEDRIELKFSVKDRGIGIHEDQIPMLFSSFTQIDSSSTRHYNGAGLGLAISKSLVEMMGGTIWVESKFGQGSTFNFTVFVGRQSEDMEREFIFPENIDDLNVLIVDDNGMTRFIISKMVQSLKLTPFTADSGEKALEMLKNDQAGTKQFDLILLDWDMPGIDGIATAKQIKENPLLSQIPIIMVTAFGQYEIMMKAEAVGIEAFLPKPIRQPLLFKTILKLFEEDAAKSDSILTRESLEGQLKGARILLAEDNVMNQQLAFEILNNAGMFVKVVNNGREAVDAVKKTVFDGILMDVQMPVMDGIEATRIIRNDMRFNEIPIIAMTAYAMDSDRKRILKAGMNDYMTKPIDSDQLFSILAKWIKLGATKPEDVAPLSKTPEAAVEIDFPKSLPGIDIESGLKKIKGNSKLYKNLLTCFYNDHISIIDRIKNALEKNNTELAQQLIHDIKGTAGNISANDLHKASLDLENVIINGKNLKKPLSTFKKALSGVMKSIEMLTKDKEDTGLKTSASSGEDFILDRSVVKPLLIKFGKLLKKNDIAAEEYLNPIIKHLSGSRLNQELRQLEDQISRIDYDIAFKTLDNLAKSLGISLEIE